MDSGFIVIWRKMTEESWYKKEGCMRLAIHLLFKANHKDKKFIFNGEEMTIQRGQLITGRKALSQEIGISEQIIRSSLALLSTTDFLTIKTTNKFSIITIVKYDEYQKTTSKITNKQPTTNQQITTNNTLNHSIKEIEGKSRPSSAEEVTAYAKSIGYPLNGQYFMDKQQAAGWVTGKARNPIKDWKAVVRTWKHNGFSSGLIQETKTDTSRIAELEKQAEERRQGMAQ